MGVISMVTGHWVHPWHFVHPDSTSRLFAERRFDENLLPILGTQIQNKFAICQESPEHLGISINMDGVYDLP